MTGRPVSTFRNTNDFATFMLFSVFIAYVCLANSKSMKGKCFYATIMFSSGALVFRTLSRANILGGLLVAILVFVGLSMKKKPTKIWPNIWLVHIIIGCIGQARRCPVISK